MDNKINFTGIKNAGAMQFLKVDSENGAKKLYTNVWVQLTDDFKGKDLSEYYSSVKKSGFHVPMFPFDKSFVYLTSIITETPNALPKLFINGKSIPSRKETTPIYTYIAKLTRNLIEQGEKNEIVVDKDFKYGNDATEYINPFGQIKLKITPENADEIFDAESVVDASKVINGTIIRRMEDFLA